MNHDGSLNSSILSTVTSASINVSVRDEQFDLEFPPGTLVTDRTERKSKGDRRYIAREGGAERIITPEEDGASYDQLVNSESGLALLQRPRFTASHWTIVALLVVCLASAWLWRRSLRRT